MHILNFTMGYEWNKKSQLFSMLVHILIKIAWKSPSLALMTVLLKWIKIWYVYLYSNKGMTLSNFPIILFYVSDFCDWLCYLWHLLFDLSKQCKFPSHLRLHIEGNFIYLFVCLCQKPFKCNQCDSDFPNPDNLLCHKRWEAICMWPV